jgi:hypothetical protein
MELNFNSTKFKYNQIHIQLKKHKMQIDAKSIENLLVISIICQYGVGKNKN